jgi:hypothetical protein
MGFQEGVDLVFERGLQHLPSSITNDLIQNTSGIHWGTEPQNLGMPYWIRNEGLLTLYHDVLPVPSLRR